MAAGVDNAWYRTRSGVDVSRYEIIDVMISGGTRLTGANEFLRVRSDERSSLVWRMNQSIWGKVDTDNLNKYENRITYLCHIRIATSF